MFHPKHWPNWFRTWHCATMNSAILPVFRQATVFQTLAGMNWAAGTTALHRGKKAATIQGSPFHRGPAGSHSLPRSYQWTYPYVWACKGLPSSPELRALQELKISSRVPHTHRPGRHHHLQVCSKATAHKGAKFYKFISGVPTSVQGSRSDLLLNSQLLSGNPSPHSFFPSLHGPVVL